MRFRYTGLPTVGGLARMTEHKILRPGDVMETAYAFWEAGDLPAVMSFVHHRIAFAVHPFTESSILGQGIGRLQFKRRLDMFLALCDVQKFHVTSLTVRGGEVDGRASFHYRHKLSGMEIEGSMRNVWQVADGKIVRLDLMTDTGLLGAFFGMGSPN